MIDIGAQVAGRIVSFGKDKQGKAVDYGSVVEAGMVLARIDDALYAADVESAKATLGQIPGRPAALRSQLGPAQGQALPG